MTDFLLELRSEEIPARMQGKAREDLAKAFAAEIARSGLVASAITTYATPRRLALIARELPTQSAAVSEEIKGPKIGAPQQAMAGFLRKVGLSEDQLTARDGVWFAVAERAGRTTAEVLAEAIPAIISAFSWPKSMRWGEASRSTESLRWVRPLQGIVALLGDEVVPCSVDGIASGRETMGHRFHHMGKITIGNAASYVADLRAAHVIVDQDERRQIIREGAVRLATKRGLTWIADEALVAENAGLTEWPVPLIGDFDPAFLDVPPEVIRLTLATNQKYFVCASPLPQAGGCSEARDSEHGGGQSIAEAEPTPNPSRKREGDLAPAFIATANIAAKDGGAAIIAGNRKVLSARLSDARFFWEQDKKTSLADHAAKLSRITFHEKLGTVADKVERVARLARWLVESGVVNSADADQAEQAARLCKADLVTEMVGEFPELQGIMGGYYARAEGLPDEVADAIRDHYRPVGAGDDVPTAPVTVAVSLADKLDTITSFFRIEEYPTGSKDPFALRRAALGIIRLVSDNHLRFSLLRAVASAQTALAAQQPLEAMGRGGGDGSGFGGGESDLPAFVLDFFADRLKVQQREAGVRHDLIDAVFAAKNEDGGGEDDLVRLLARVHALQSFMATDDGTNLLSAYKRAANILKADSSDRNNRHPELVSGSIAPNEPKGEADKWMLKQVQHDGLGEAERDLLTALTAAEPTAAVAVTEERFADAMAALASLRAPIDAFFDGVMVNDPDAAVRAFRLGLLVRFRDACHAVADFSKIEG